MDLAVIQVQGAPELTPIEFADSNTLNVGDVTVAIGCAARLRGNGDERHRQRPDRSIVVASSAAPQDESQAPNGDDGSGDPFDRFPLRSPRRADEHPPVLDPAPGHPDRHGDQPGNSGGALLDANGRLVGINVAIAGSTGGNVGIGFAIPSNTVKRIASEIIATGSATHGLLGVSVADVATDPAQKDADVVGASVVTVVDGGGAANAGIRVGDIIVEFDGVPITSRIDLMAQVRTHAIGAKVPLVIVRGGSRRPST